MKLFLSACEHGAQQEAFPYIIERERDDMKIMLSALEQGSRSPVVIPAIAKRERGGNDMKMFLSGFNDDVLGAKPHLGLKEGSNPDPLLLWNLVSYYYMRNHEGPGTLVRDNSREIMVDSGAFSFMHGQKANFDQYVKDYSDFISTWDRPNVIGYFEMDIDSVVGYDKVLQYRRILENVTDKIIPVWHNSRGINNYIQMCKDYSGGIVAITGVHKEIRDQDFPKFLKTAHDYDCKLHCLGMTRKNILDTVPFDYVDSSSWAIQTIFGKLGGHKKKIDQQFCNQNRGEVFAYSYLQAMKTQRYYYEKWRAVSKD